MLPTPPPNSRRESRDVPSIADQFIMPLLHSIRCTIIRSLAAALGCFALLNLLGDRLRPGFDANLWWIDLRALPAWLSAGFLFALSIALIAFAVQPTMLAHRKWATFALTAIACFCAFVNAVVFFSLSGSGRIDAGLPLPFSLVIALVLAAAAYEIGMRSHDHSHGKVSRFTTLCTAGLTMLIILPGFPLAQMFFFGKTDYTRKADAIIVPGARAYADGRASVPLADRVATACDLYHQGRAPLLIFSGGPGDGEAHETQVMRNLAIDRGVPSDAILLDPQGHSTQATAEHTCLMLDRLEVTRAIVVSHFYHLPRIKLAYQRQGRDVFTVPAKESYTLRAMPAYMLREVAAIWWYYLRPLVG